MRKWILALIVVLSIFNAGEAGASLPTNYCDKYKVNPDGSASIFNYGVRCSEDLIFYIVGFQRNAAGEVEPATGSTLSLMGQMISIFRDVVRTIFIIYVVLFGYKLITGGVRNIGAESLIAIIKLAAVAFFALGVDFGFYYQVFLNFSDSMTGLFATYTYSNCGFASLPPAQAIWIRADCTFWGFLGQDLSLYAEPTVLLVIGLALMFSWVGIIIVMLFLIGSVMIIAGFATAALTYIICIIALTFLVSLAPIMVPLFLFERTASIFKNWFEMLIGYSLQPVVIMAYLALMMKVMNVMLWGDPVSGNAGLTTLFDNALANIERVPLIFGLTYPVMSDTWWNGGAREIFIITFIAVFATSAILLVFLLNVVKFSNHLTGLGASTENLAGKVNIVGLAAKVMDGVAKTAKGAVSGAMKGGVKGAAVGAASAAGNAAKNIAR